MKKKKLKELLSQVKTFENPKMSLEQYCTGWENVAEILMVIQERYQGDWGKLADLGAGTGLLAIGGCFLGFEEIDAYEVDKEAISVFQENLEIFEIENINIIQMDLKESKIEQKYDCVIMNPPFGTKDNEILKVFLDQALNISNRIYIIHKKTCFFLFNYLKAQKIDHKIVHEFKYKIPNLEFEHKDLKNLSKKLNKKKSALKHSKYSKKGKLLEIEIDLILIEIIK